jgi:hypothetical protein
VVCGRGGPIASHPPDVCYRGAGYTPIGDQKRADETITEEGPLKGHKFELNYLKFRPPATQPDSQELEIRWSFLTPEKGLQAPESPRLEFASKNVLYKVYVNSKRMSVASAVQESTVATTSPLPSAASTNVHDPGKFLKAFLPRFEAALKDPPPPR